MASPALDTGSKTGNTVADIGQHRESQKVSTPGPAGQPSGCQAGKTSASNEYGGYVARLVVLLAVLLAGWLLNYLSAGQPYFVFLTFGGILLVSFTLIIRPRNQVVAARLVVPLLDLAWITFAMYLTHGLNSFLLPLLYVVVAVVAMRGDRWEMGTTLAGAVTSIFVLAIAHHSGGSVALAAAQSTLLAAGALAVRLIISTRPLHESAHDPTQLLYDELLASTSDAVLRLSPDDWRIIDANPASLALLGYGNGNGDSHAVVGQSMVSVLRFDDPTFLPACRARLAEDEPVRASLTHAWTRDGRDLCLKFSLSAVPDHGKGPGFIHAVVEVGDDQMPAGAAGCARRSADFITEYIPSLTHELNNHLAAIRLAAELAEATGKAPDFAQMQSQVDHCQEVLQTVVLQIMSSAAPIQTPAKTPVCNLRTVVERALLLSRPQVLSSNVQLQLKAPNELPQVNGFAHELQEALLRIVIHCAKGMTEQEQPRALTITISPREEEVEVILRDCGTGLSWGDIAAISGRQVPISKSEEREWETIREGICRFGGTIHATNGLNGGARFKITLPIAEEQRGSKP